MGIYSLTIPIELLTLAPLEQTELRHLVISQLSHFRMCASNFFGSS